MEMGGNNEYGFYDKTTSPIIGWVAPKDGYYKLDLRAKHTAASNQPSGCSVLTTYLPVGQSEDNNALQLIELEQNTETKQAESVIKYMNAGDRYMIRFMCAQDSGTRKINVWPTVTEMLEFDSKISINDGVMTAKSEYNDLGQKFEEEQEVQFVYAVYKDGKIVGVFNSESKWCDVGGGTGIVETTYNLPTNEDGYTAVSYVWDSLDGMKPLAEPIR